MAHKIGIAVEFLEEKDRDRFLTQLGELLEDYKVYAGKVTVSREVKKGRNTTKVVSQIELAFGETFDLTDFGLLEELPMEKYIREAQALESKGATVYPGSARPRTA